MTLVKILGVLLIVLIAFASGFFAGSIFGANAEEKRYLERYPKLGRLRVNNNSYKFDFGIDPAEIPHYKGALFDIVEFSEKDISVGQMTEEEMLDAIREAEEARDALKT